jgi:hypothetical protein
MRVLKSFVRVFNQVCFVKQISRQSFQSQDDTFLGVSGVLIIFQWEGTSEYIEKPSTSY